MNEIACCVSGNHLTTHHSRSTAIIQVEIAARIPIGVEEDSVAIVRIENLRVATSISRVTNTGMVTDIFRLDITKVSFYRCTRLSS